MHIKHVWRFTTFREGLDLARPLPLGGGRALYDLLQCGRVRRKCKPFVTRNLTKGVSDVIRGHDVSEICRALREAANLQLVSDFAVRRAGLYQARIEDADDATVLREKHW